MTRQDSHAMFTETRDARSRSRRLLSKARAFRSRIEAADVSAIQVIQRTSRKLVERMERHPVPGRETLTGIVRAWRGTAPFAQISPILHVGVTLPLGRCHVALGRRKALVRMGIVV